MSPRFNSIIFFSLFVLAPMYAHSDGIEEVNVDDEDRTARIVIPQKAAREQSGSQVTPTKSEDRSEVRVVRIVTGPPAPCAEIQTIKDINRDSECLQIQDSGTVALNRTSANFISFEKQGSLTTVTCLNASHPAERMTYKYAENGDGKVSEFMTPNRNLTFEYKDGKCYGRIGSALRPSIPSSAGTILIPKDPDGAIR